MVTVLAAQLEFGSPASCHVVGMLSLPVILVPKAEEGDLQSRLASYISHSLGLWT